MLGARLSSGINLAGKFQEIFERFIFICKMRRYPRDREILHADTRVEKRLGVTAGFNGVVSVHLL